MEITKETRVTINLIYVLKPIFVLNYLQSKWGTVAEIACLNVYKDWYTKFGSVVEWLKCRARDQHGLGSKPTRAILLCPCEDTLRDVLNYSNIFIPPRIEPGTCSLLCRLLYH